ncbi:MAG: hypothetical protein D6720_03685 [Gammaproteobacteria bacterium]|nr:MAG: hypothetical protein D6720_03685 [Gammaproteobacteria bacterium]
MKALFLGLILLSGLAQAGEPVQRIQQMVDYLGVDYRGAVSNGAITDPSEYDEMQDFAHTLVQLAAELPATPVRAKVQRRLQALKTLVYQRADPKQVAVLSAELRQLLISGYGLSVVPRKAPDMARGAALYAEDCAACHGLDGRGNGPMAAQLDPKPTDFTDVERYRERTLYGLYSTITHGVEGTAMQSWAKLPEDDRWALAFHVGSLAARKLIADQQRPAELPAVTKEMLTTRTPAELAAQLGEQGDRVVAWLRTHPDGLWGSAKGAGIRFAIDHLEQARQAYAQGDAKRAHELAVTAYLEGFELVESNLDAMDSALRHQIESGMTELRGLIKGHAPVQQVDERITQLESQLQQAAEKLNNDLLSPAGAFTASLVILLREGLEAILVIAALAAFLIKTGRCDGLRYLYYGTGAALGLGLLTWYVSSEIVAIGGAGREMTEAFAALFAALLLFYVGFWLHSKTSAVQWKRFIQDSVQKVLNKETLWGLAVLAFIAVYREIFETVLFYQALWLQAGEEGRAMVATGLLLAAGALALLAWLILRFSTRLPLRQFFSVTSIFMFVLAVVFAGKGIAALQEAGLLSSRQVNFPSIDLLGIYPNLEGLGVQLLMVIVAVLLLWRGSKGGPKDQTGGSNA